MSSMLYRLFVKQVVNEFGRNAAKPSCHPPETNRFVRPWPHLTHAFSFRRPTRNRHQTVSGSVQPFLQGTRTWPTDRQTDTQTDWLRDRPHYFMCSNGPLSLANVAMPPKIMYLPFIFGPIPNLLTCEILTMLTDDAYQRWFNDDRGIQTLLLMLLLRPLHCHPSSSQLNASIIVSERFRRKWL